MQAPQHPDLDTLYWSVQLKRCRSRSEFLDMVARMLRGADRRSGHRSPKISPRARRKAAAGDSPVVPASPAPWASKALVDEIDQGPSWAALLKDGEPRRASPEPLREPDELAAAVASLERRGWAGGLGESGTSPPESRSARAEPLRMSDELATAVASLGRHNEAGRLAETGRGHPSPLLVGALHNAAATVAETPPRLIRGLSNGSMSAEPTARAEFRTTDRLVAPLEKTSAPARLSGDIVATNMREDAAVHDFAPTDEGPSIEYRQPRMSDLSASSTVQQGTAPSGTPAHEPGRREVDAAPRMTPGPAFGAPPRHRGRDDPSGLQAHAARQASLDDDRPLQYAADGGDALLGLHRRNQRLSARVGELEAMISAERSRSGRLESELYAATQARVAADESAAAARAKATALQAKFEGHAATLAPQSMPFAGNHGAGHAPEGMDSCALASQVRQLSALLQTEREKALMLSHQLDTAAADLRAARHVGADAIRRVNAYDKPTRAQAAGIGAQARALAEAEAALRRMRAS